MKGSCWTPASMKLLVARPSSDQDQTAGPAGGVLVTAAARGLLWPVGTKRSRGLCPTWVLSYAAGNLHASCAEETLQTKLCKVKTKATCHTCICKATRWKFVQRTTLRDAARFAVNRLNLSRLCFNDSPLNLVHVILCLFTLFLEIGNLFKRG